MQERVAQRIRRTVDLLYVAPLRKAMPLSTFRYAAAGAINLGLNVLIYFVSFHYILQKDHFEILPWLVISAPIMAFGIAFVITFFTGFWLTRMIAFEHQRNLRGREQLLRYGQIVALNVAVNYFGLKLLVDVWDFYPTPSYLAIQILTVAISYLGSRFYTFK